MFGAGYNRCLLLTTALMFQFFRNALDTQNEELKMLHNEVTELERVNSEILDFVHKNGRLPEIVSRLIRILLLKINERGNLELAPNKDDIGVYRGSESNHDDKHQQLEVFLKSINMLRFCYNQVSTFYRLI